MLLASRSRGFSLLELSIVLTVIGLLLGALFFTRTVIEASEARKVIRQLQQIEVAVVAFKEKYNCLPGDCAFAADFGLGLNGDGNGYLDRNGGLTTNGGSTSLVINPDPGVGWLDHTRIRDEQQYFWIHLANAGLIEGSYSALAVNDTAVAEADMAQYFPKDALGKGYLTVFTWGGKLFLRTGLKKLDNFKHGDMSTAVLNATQMNNIADDYSKTVIINSTHYNTLYNGPKVQPLGLNTGHSTYVRQLVKGTEGGTGWTACVSNTGSNYYYNVENNGSCNVLYRIDY